MARKTPLELIEKPKVYCSQCKRFKRDTEGISRSVITGEYFMGLCPMMHADGVIKYDRQGNAIGGRVFADKPRDCEDYSRLEEKATETANVDGTRPPVR